MTTAQFKSLSPTLFVDNMSTASLKIKYTNYAEPVAEGATFGENNATVNATSTLGINIFRQSFPLDQTIRGDQTALILTEAQILAKLNEILVSTKADGTVQATAVEQVGASSTDKFAGLTTYDAGTTDAQGLVAVENVPGNYVLRPGYGLVFKAQQGSGAANANTRYVTYYCYFKEMNPATGVTENLWAAFITGDIRAPLLFDIQDGRDVIFNCTAPSGAGVTGLTVNSIESTNFLIKSNGSGYNTLVDLKNTAFNLSSDDTAEDKVYVEPFLCFRSTVLAL